jgi:hypothetical protein
MCPLQSIILQKHSLVPIVPPLLLLAKDFTKTYGDKLEVLQADDLSMNPCVEEPCINVQNQDLSMYI